MITDRSSNGLGSRSHVPILLEPAQQPGHRRRRDLCSASASSDGYGEDEPGAGVGGDTLASLLADVRVERLPAAGHFAFLERPAAFRSLLRSFLGRSTH